MVLLDSENAVDRLLKLSEATQRGGDCRGEAANGDVAAMLTS